MLIREDQQGLYIQSRFGPAHPPYRPRDKAPGWDHVYRVGSCGLKKGDNPKTSHMSSAPAILIDTGDDSKILWLTEGQ